MYIFQILPQSSGDSDPEAHSELKKPQDPSEISGGIFGNLLFRSGQNYIKMLYKEISRNDPETPTLDPERYFIDPKRQFESSG